MILGICRAEIQSKREDSVEDIRSILQQTWPKWEIIDKIGEGAFASVYKVKRQDLAGIKFAAVKVIKIPRDSNEIEELYAEGLLPSQTYAYYQGVVKDYTAEIKLMDAVKAVKFMAKMGFCHTDNCTANWRDITWDSCG